MMHERELLGPCRSVNDFSFQQVQRSEQETSRNLFQVAHSRELPQAKKQRAGQFMILWSGISAKLLKLQCTASLVMKI